MLEPRRPGPERLPAGTARTWTCAPRRRCPTRRSTCAGTRTRATCPSTGRTTTSIRATASRSWRTTTTRRRARSSTRRPAGVNVTVTFLSDEGDGLGGTAACVFSGTALAGLTVTRDSAFRAAPAQRLRLPTRARAVPAARPLTPELRMLLSVFAGLALVAGLPPVPARGGDRPLLLLDDPAAADRGLHGRRVLGGVRPDRVERAAGDLGGWSRPALVPVTVIAVRCWRRR